MQLGDNQESRRPLPHWMGIVLEFRVAQFVDEAQKWHERILKRDSKGKPLTASQKLKYEQWKTTLDPKIIFDKVKKASVTDAAHVSSNCVAVQLHLSKDPNELQLSACTGTRFQLVLLKGPKTQAVEEVPNDFDGPVPEDAIEALQQETGEEEEDDIGEEAAAALQDDMRADAEQNGVDPDEILCDSDNESVEFGLHGTGVSKVKTFSHRAEYVKLEALHLTMIPRHIKGCSLGFHKTSNQWQGYYPGATSGLSAKFGGKTLRTEKEAILRVIRGILIAHISSHPKDAMWQLQLEKIQQTEATM